MCVCGVRERPASTLQIIHYHVIFYTAVWAHCLSRQDDGACGVATVEKREKEMR